MNTTRLVKTPWLATAVAACSLLLPLQAADLITNGDFEAGLAGWTRIDQLGSAGTFFLQTGSTSPVISQPVPPPPQGSFAAMTDAEGSGSHVLYQDFFVTAASSYTLNFSLFIGNLADAFYTPDTLDFATPVLNQQARVDLMITSSDPFSVAGGDVLQNVYKTSETDPLISGYNDFSVDVTALLAAHQNETLRLRFADADNVFIFNFGVDQVSLTTDSAHVPEGLSWWLQYLSIIGVLALGSAYHRHSRIANTTR